MRVELSEEMKDIKFRVWDNQENKFLIKNQTLARGDIKGLFCEIIDFEDYSIQLDNPDDNRYIFLQYTGLKDENSKEIYEGDILLDEHTREYCKIIFEDCCFIASFDTYEIDLNEINENLVIVGNIYENSELRR